MDTVTQWPRLKEPPSFVGTALELSWKDKGLRALTALPRDTRPELAPEEIQTHTCMCCADLLNPLTLSCGFV